MTDDNIVQKAKRILLEYFEFNQNQGTDEKMVWDETKAVLRGFFIKHNAIQKKKNGNLGGNLVK